MGNQVSISAHRWVNRVAFLRERRGMASSPKRQVNTQKKKKLTQDPCLKSSGSRKRLLDSYLRLIGQISSGPFGLIVLYLCAVRIMYQETIVASWGRGNGGGSMYLTT